MIRLRVYGGSMKTMSGRGRCLDDALYIRTYLGHLYSAQECHSDLNEASREGSTLQRGSAKADN
jgi:hypothetical protein